MFINQSSVNCIVVSYIHSNHEESTQLIEMITVCFQTVFPLHLLFFFLSIARYMPRDFWMESLVMKLTKFWMSDSLLDSNLAMVCFLIMDLVSCLAWSVIKELGFK